MVVAVVVVIGIARSVVSARLLALQLWAALAGMALEGRHLDTAEIALAAISELDKLQYILYVKDIPSEEGPVRALPWVTPVQTDPVLQTPPCAMPVGVPWPL